MQIFLLCEAGAHLGATQNLSTCGQKATRNTMTLRLPLYVCACVCLYKIHTLVHNEEVVSVRTRDLPPEQIHECK